MNDDRFEAMVRQLGTASSRRNALRIFGGAVAGMATMALFGIGTARAVLCPWGQICCAPGGLVTDIVDCLAGGGTCIDPFTDPNNCGLCGSVCSGSSPICSGGACTAGGGGNATTVPSAPTTAPTAPTTAPSAPPSTTSAPSGGGVGAGQGGCSGQQTLCNPGSANPYCAELQTDDNNCGFCGYWCGVYGICENGACVCQHGYTRCGGQGTNGVCSDMTSDGTNCGGCGNVCQGGQVCQNSRCVCPAGQTC